MEHDDLLNLLDLNAKVKPTKQTKQFAATEQELEEEWSEEHQPSETVIALDEWDEDRGGRLHKLLKRDEKFLRETQDFFALAYKADPHMNESCVDSHRQKYIEGVMASTDYRVLRQSTFLNEVTSEMAAKEFIDKYEELKKQLKENENLSPRQQRQLSKELRDEAAMDSAIHDALSEAQDQIDEVMECARAIGMEEGDNRGMDPRRILDTYHKVRHNWRLKQIIDAAGKYRRLARAKQRQKVTHGYDDIVGVEMSGDVHRLLPLELALLADEDFELDAMRRLVERQSMSREFRGVEKVGKGPIVIIVDESDSMSGEPIANAKAFALAMAWIARQQKRFCVLASFASSYQGRYIVLPPNKWDETKLLDWLGGFYAGGTDSDYPLRTIPSKWVEMEVPRGKTDMIIITDGLLHVDQRLRESFTDFKSREKVKLLSMIMYSAPGELQYVSDEWYLINGISIDNAVVGKCLSI